MGEEKVMGEKKIIAGERLRKRKKFIQQNGCGLRRRKEGFMGTVWL